jgi:hypothetical protein
VPNGTPQIGIIIEAVQKVIRTQMTQNAQMNTNFYFIIGLLKNVELRTTH